MSAPRNLRHGLLTGSEVEELLALTTHFTADAIVAVIHAAIDESGAHGPADLVCVSVVSGTKRQWRLFTDDWNRIRFKLPKKYHALDKYFDGPGGANEQLALLMRRRMDYAGAILIRRSVFTEEVDDLWRARYATEYSMGVMTCVQLMTALYAAKVKGRGKKPPKVFYHVADGAKSIGHVVNILNDLEQYQSEDLRIASHALLPGTNPIIHPPDLVAHEYATDDLDAEPTAAMAALRDWVIAHPMKRERIRETVEWTRRMEAKHKYRQPGSPKPPYDGFVEPP